MAGVMQRRAMWALFVVPFLIAQGVAGQGTPQSPEQVLGYGIGERFTDHAGVLRYMQTLAAAAPGMVRVQKYGDTNEARDLVQVVFARADYMTRLDEILQRNRQLTDPNTTAEQARVIAASNPGVVYFSYGVHGNESSSSETAMWTAWDIVRNAPEVAGVLDSLIVIIDPVVNPDGRDRYVNWYRQARGIKPNPEGNSREHSEPWPGGRTNHYMFDLNRDWAWATQRETRARLATWDRWSPQVHVDFHEMGANSNYFFFPAAAPINPMYPKHILEWGKYFGEANARAFDANGWAYFTGATYDLFYPGYGDSWPSLLGAIGMTYEQAGGGGAGQILKLNDDSFLTLADRASHHRTSGNATLRASAARKNALLTDFSKFYQTMGDNTPDILIVPGLHGRDRALQELLQAQGIRVERATRTFKATATAHHGYSTRKDFPEGTLLVRARQPRGRLAVTLLQPETVLDAVYSYDISAWSLPFAYGIEAHSVTRAPDAGWVPASVPTVNAAAIAPGTATYGLLAEPGFANWPVVIRYLKAGGKARVIGDPFTIDGRRWPAGTIFFPRFGVTNFAETARAAGLLDIAVPVSSGRVTAGNDLGTQDSYNLKLPRIALLSGEGTSANAMGAQWFFLENTLQVDFDQLPVARVASADLDDYDVIIAPDGSLAEPARNALKAWVQKGGTLIATGSAARGSVATLAEIKLREDPKPPDSSRITRGLRTREERELEDWRDQVPGAILSVKLDPRHPLSFGAGVAGDSAKLYVLHNGNAAFEPDPAFESVGYFTAELSKVSGVISETNLKRMERGSWLATKSIGSGTVILFIDDPIFRHFWYSAFQPFANAIMIGPSM